MSTTPRLLGGRYEIGGLLGRGGMAEVHLGRDSRLGRTVAIKMLRSDLARDPAFQVRFRREAQSAAALNHPAVVAVYDTGEDTVTESGGATSSVPYIVMEYVEGTTLRDQLRAPDPDGDGSIPAADPTFVPGAQTSEGTPANLRMPVDHALRTTAGVLAALEYSHRAGIVHRDIKPANVMVTGDGDIKVMDFGIARAVADSSATMTQTQAVIGTAQYLSPEQARGEQVDARSDLYSAGCLLYELLTGRPPFVGDSPVSVAYQHVREDPQPPSHYNPEIGEDVDRVVLHSLAKDREERYQSAQAFRDDITHVLAGRAIEAPAIGAAALAAGQPTEAMSTVPAGATTAMPRVSRIEEVVEESPEPDAKSGRAGRWILAGLAAALVIAMGVFLAMNLLGEEDPEQIRVAAVIGETQEAASDQLTADGFEVVVETAASDEVAEGLVAEQDPPADELAAIGSTVTITVSQGPDTVEVPPLVGLSLDDARATLAREGLELGTITRENRPGVDVDEVISTSPAPGEAVEPSTAISVVVASGQVSVPNVVGQPREDAETALRDAGLEVTATEVPTADAEAGTVTEQNPREGATLASGDTVTLEVAVAPPTPVVNVDPAAYIGQPVANVVAALEQAGLVVDQQPGAGNGAAAGTVVDVAPSGEVEVGTVITVIVATEEAPAEPQPTTTTPAPGQPEPPPGG